jgi:hypothetical protein
MYLSLRGRLIPGSIPYPSKTLGYDDNDKFVVIRYLC